MPVGTYILVGEDLQSPQVWCLYSLCSSNNLAGAFDIRIMTSQTQLQLVKWIYSRMDDSVKGDFTVGGRGQNRSFHGDVASMIVTTLIRMLCQLIKKTQCSI